MTIAGIAILAALLFPVLGKLQRSAKISRAREEMSVLAAAVNAYYATYSQLPAPAEAAKAGNDFTFGTVGLKGKGFAPAASLLGLPKILTTSERPGVSCPMECNCPTVSKGPGGLVAASYQANNGELIAILRDIEHFRLPGTNTTSNVNHSRNPKRKVFLHVKDASGVLSPDVGDDLVFRDPWGNPYIVTLDLNYDDVCLDGFYRMAHISEQLPPHQNAADGLMDTFRGKKPCFAWPTVQHPGDRHGFFIRRKVVVWSFGPDGTADFNWGNSPSQKANAGYNKDNILSWR